MRSKFSRVNVGAVGPSAAPVRYAPEVPRMDGGYRVDSAPHLLELNQSPYMTDVRFEGGAIRKDFGWTQKGDAASTKVLALAQHRYYKSGSEYIRLVRVRRTAADGYAIVDVWDGSDWDSNADSSAAGITLDDQLASVVGTLGYFCIATGSDDILYWNENPSPVTREDDFASSLDLDETDDNAEITLSNEPAHNDQYIVSYELVLSFKCAEAGVGSVEIVVRIDAYSGSSWVEVDKQTFDAPWYSTAVACNYSQMGAGAVRRTIDAAAKGVTDVSKFRVYVESYTQDNVGSDSSRVSPCNKATDGDDYAGCEYDTVTAGGTLDSLDANSPHATYIFAFADRLVALGDKVQSGDAIVQTMSWCVSGDPTDWTGSGSGSALLEDTQAAPVNELKAGVALSQEVAAIFRERSIMRAYRTGSASAAIGVGSWHEDIGTESPFSVVPVPNGALFLGHDRMVYLLSLNQLIPVGEPIRDELIADVTTNLDLVYGVYDNVMGEYWMGVPVSGATVLSRVYAFDHATFLKTGEAKWRRKAITNNAICFAVVGRVS